jgi:hemin uptake protein HemP
LTEKDENDYRLEMTPESSPVLPIKTPRSAPSQTFPRQVSSDQLLGGQGELVILHAGRQYRLRVTQNGKLILTA